MQLITRLFAAIFNFVVGDMRLLIGTVLALVITSVIVRVSPEVAGLLLFALFATTLTVALQRETKP